MTYKTEFGDYEEMYGGLDYNGRVVLDIGADYGTTARYFLGRGAAKVVASERRNDWCEELDMLAGSREDVVSIGPIMDGHHLAQIIDLYRPNIVKVDCEGCEWMMGSVPHVALSVPEAWVIETHSDPLHEAVTTLLATCGYAVTIVCDYGPMRTNPEKVVRVFRAVRS